LGDLAHDPRRRIDFNSILWTDGNARCVIATLLTGHGDEHGIVCRKAFPVGNRIHPQPGDAGAFRGFLLSRRNVILHSTGNHAHAATRAAVKINHHTVS
jgi:hypothetical protein